MPPLPRQLVRQVSTRLARRDPRSKHILGQPLKEDAQRLPDLRTRAEALSRDLFAENEPYYPSDEANILRLEMDYSDRRRLATGS